MVAWTSIRRSSCKPIANLGVSVKIVLDPMAPHSRLCPPGKRKKSLRLRRQPVTPSHTRNTSIQQLLEQLE